jgi:hypothetical protein
MIVKPKFASEGNSEMCLICCLISLMSIPGTTVLTLILLENFFLQYLQEHHNFFYCEELYDEPNKYFFV